MSEPPQKKHPWAKYYAEGGASRPPMGEPPPSPPAKATAGTTTAPFGKASRARSEKRPELAAAVAAVNASLPGATAAPFITAMQREALLRERKRVFRRRMVLIGAGALAGLALIHLAVTRVFYRTPSDAALQAHVENVASAVMPLYSTRFQPLQIDHVGFELTDRIDAQHLRYSALVRFTLRQPLYAAALTNGTTRYRQLQESLHAAQARELKLHLFSPADAPPVPELPLLIQAAHRTGETVTVRVPFGAHRFGWRWRIDPAQLGLRSMDRVLEGDAIERYAKIPHLIFGAQGTLADMRQRMREASDYIIAVTKEAQKHPEMEVVADAPAGVDPLAPAAGASPGVATVPAIEPGAADPDAPAKPAEMPAEKAPVPAAESVADKPAVDEAGPQIVFPKKNAPADGPRPEVDPNAPAIALPDKPAAPAGDGAPRK